LNFVQNVPVAQFPTCISPRDAAEYPGGGRFEFRANLNGLRFKRLKLRVLSRSGKDFLIPFADRLVISSYIENVRCSHVLALEDLALR